MSETAEFFDLVWESIKAQLLYLGQKHSSNRLVSLHLVKVTIPYTTTLASKVIENVTLFSGRTFLSW